MAYGVKYRLEFSDVLGYGKKVEILKRDYTGDILPMIGSANPVIISWQSSNDFYSPIIGSKCQLNLFVTDDVTYDDFYKFDEREYKVVVYYNQTQGGLYSDRVSDDGGSIESIDCVENTIDPTLTTSTSFRRNILNEGGSLESIGCISDKITEYKIANWAEYWSGFLVVDRYKEKMITPPFAVSFNAFDGLGTLNNFDSPIGYNNNNAPISKTNLQRITEILENLNLYLDIHIASDIKFRTFLPFASIDYEDITTLDFGFDEMTGDYGLLNAKEQLELILRQYNLRIFQSYNKWHIVEVTNIFDYYVKDMILNQVQTGTTPTQIRDKITTQLESTSEEYLDFRKYNYYGASIGTERKQVLYSNKNDLIETGNSLSREFLQPASEVHILGRYLKTKNAFYNSGFEYGDYGFDIFVNTSLPPTLNITNGGSGFASGTRNYFVFGGSGSGMVVEATISGGGVQSLVVVTNGSGYLLGDILQIVNNSGIGVECMFEITALPYYAEIATDEISFQGRRSMKLADFAPTTGFTQMFSFETDAFNPQEVKYSDFTCKVKYYVHFLNSQNPNISSNLSYTIFTFVNGTGYYWNSEIGKFSSTYFGTNTITTEFANKWIDVNIALNDTDLNIGTSTSATIKFFISNTQCSSTEYDTTYYDNFQILQSKTSASESDQKFISKLTNVGINTNIKKVTRIPDQKSGYFRTRGAYPSTSFKPFSIDLMTVLGKNISNDYRNFVTRYTGTFRNLKREPMSIHNKIWHYFSANEFDPQSSIIDGLTYNVKNAEFKVVSHLPNNDDDTPTTSIIN